jgi:hypothetical protein
MRGDFSRDTFDPLRRFSRVLMQQGRIQLDADWNEQAAIQLYLLRGLAADLIGPHGGPGDSFLIRDKDASANGPVKNDFVISAGRYYVDGWLCQNDARVFFRGSQTLPQQPYYEMTPELEAGRRYLVYLDAWERHVSYAEIEGPQEAELRTPSSLRELALGGPDTTTRAQVVWQVRAIELPDDELGGTLPATPAAWRTWVDDHWETFEERWEPTHRGRLKVEARKPLDDDKSPCAISPESRYRGLENQLYRVEIHRGGAAHDERTGGGAGSPATFKWSRENGSVVFPIRAIDGKRILLEGWWRDDRFALSEGQWVEVLDDRAALHHRADVLRRVAEIDRDAMAVTLNAEPDTAVDITRHPLLRRWDHRARAAAKGSGSSLASDNALPVVEERWIELEDGVRVWFERSRGAAAHRYRTGDYWSIPARTAIGDVVWPRERTAPDGSAPALKPPHGVDHHFAPLAVIAFDNGGSAGVVADVRRKIVPLAEPTT